MTIKFIYYDSMREREQKKTNLLFFVFLLIYFKRIYSPQDNAPGVPLTDSVEAFFVRPTEQCALSFLVG
jgi:hypothetical protein